MLYESLETCHSVAVLSAACSHYVVSPSTYHICRNLKETFHASHQSIYQSKAPDHIDACCIQQCFNVHLTVQSRYLTPIQGSTLHKPCFTIPRTHPHTTASQTLFEKLMRRSYLGK